MGLKSIFITQTFQGLLHSNSFIYLSVLISVSSKRSKTRDLTYFPEYTYYFRCLLLDVMQSKQRNP